MLSMQRTYQKTMDQMDDEKKKKPVMEKTKKVIAISNTVWVCWKAATTEKPI